MGKPATRCVALPPEYIGRVEGTWRTETSKYPEEKKTIVIPSVAASESGAAQTARVFLCGVVGLLTWELPNHLLTEWHGKASHRW